MNTCSRCGENIRTDVWGRWVDRWLWRTCGGDSNHEPAQPTGCQT